MAKSIWRRLIPSDPRKCYTRASRHAFYTPGARRQPFALMHMLSLVRADTRGLHHTSERPTATIFLRYKNAEKCRLLLNVVRINASDTPKEGAAPYPQLLGQHCLLLQIR